MQTIRLLAVGVFAFAGAAMADLAGFEQLGDLGYVEGDRIENLTTDAGTGLSFKLSDGPTGIGASSGLFVGEVGYPEFGFMHGDGLAVADLLGTWFLHTNPGSDKESWRAGNYVIEFDRAVAGVELDIFDLRTDGSAKAGDVIEFVAYGDLGYENEIARMSYEIDANLPDMNVQHVALQAEGIRAVVLLAGSDIGTGIDNLRVTEAAVPTPMAGALAAPGLLLAARRRR